MSLYEFLNTSPWPSKFLNKLYKNFVRSNFKTSSERQDELSNKTHYTAASGACADQGEQRLHP
jgi:hypothetical protein